ncbi:phytoene desaturase [Ceraceosorus guamensis]|uniref:Phytoene desaturase n=1 Tax=Ceraceosorus guamensis TaxID=1522189 RepID=A0A316W486_9BASI|nr:phytoene desaturase [Ceraceosorus guamensis]PWN42435.1 phytoene desaturase [Ceraceosorus guamensis]
MPGAPARGQVASGRTCSKNAKHVVIIGAGAGGTCLAARLAHKGYRVTVVERHAGVGGRCSLDFHPEGHRWDVGPSLYLMPEIFDRAFASMGRSREKLVPLTLASPAYTIHYHDGRSLQLSSDLTAMGAVLEKFERPCGNPDPLGNFLEFLNEAGQHYEESIRWVLGADWTHLLEALTRWEMYPMLFKTRILHIWTTLYSRASSFFYSDHIRRAMTFSSMYMGMSPFDAPATYSLLQYAEYAKGVWYPIGGFQRVVAAFEQIAKEEGASFLFNTNVKQIKLDAVRGAASGVELSDGRKIEADVVVSNADLVSTYNKLLPPSPYADRLTRKDQTCSSISFYWGLKEIVPELGGHNIFLAEAYKESFDEIFREGKLPSEPSFYVNVPSRLDPTAAPLGRDTLVVLVPCGPLPLDASTSRAEFEVTRARARRQVIATLNARLGDRRAERRAEADGGVLKAFDEKTADAFDIESLIAVEQVMDPFDWQERFDLFRGSILGLSHTIPQVLWFRPSVQHATYRNLFFCGASTQPGTGVPVVVAGSAVVAKRIDDFLSKKSSSASFLPRSLANICAMIATLIALLVAALR